MTARIVLVIVMLGSSLAVADKAQQQEALKKMEQLTGDMCKCKDKACAEKVTVAMTAWATEIAKKATKDDKPDAEMMKKFEQVSARLTKCMTDAMTGKGGAVEPDTNQPAKPSAELKDLVKQLGGTWRCTGRQATGKSAAWRDMTSTVTTKLSRAIDDTWAETTLTSGKQKVIIFTTYNTAGKQWLRYGITNTLLGLSQTSSGPKDGSIVWQGEANMMSVPVKVRSTDDFSDPKLLKSSDEISMDQGKTWSKIEESSCKR